jgi:hypothetical protein
MSDKSNGTTPQNSTNPEKPNLDIVIGPTDVYIQGSVDGATIIIKSDTKNIK